MNGPTALWVLVAVPFVLLLLVVLAAGYGAYALRRTIEMAASKSCPNCGRPIGRPAVLAGKERFSEKMAELRKQHPGVKFKIVAEWEIHCPQCAAIFYFYPESGRIETESLAVRTARG